jgi:hypothetical protein
MDILHIRTESRTAGRAGLEVMLTVARRVTKWVLLNLLASAQVPTTVCAWFCRTHLLSNGDARAA